jgi:hypothetical protein
MGLAHDWWQAINPRCFYIGAFFTP